MRKEHYEFDEKERSIKRFAKRAERWELEDYYRAVLDELGARKSDRKRSEEGKKMRKSGKIIAFLAIPFCLIGIFCGYKFYILAGEVFLYSVQNSGLGYFVKAIAALLLLGMTMVCVFGAKTFLVWGVKYLRLGRKITRIAKEPDDVLIFRKGSLEQILRGCENEETVI